MKKLSKIIVALVVVLAVTALFAIKTDAATMEEITFNAQYYLHEYPDVARAVNNDPTAAYGHYMNNGIKEGRSGSPLFDVNYYVTYNADLYKAFGYEENRENAWVSAYNHFVTTGVNELRPTSRYFDVKYYLSGNANSDLANAGLTSRQGYDHYLASGIYEGRDTKEGIDMSCYIGRYADVRNAYGLTLGGRAGQPYKDVAMHLFMFADDDARLYAHTPNVLVQPVKCGETGTAIYMCPCGEESTRTEVEVTSPLSHEYEVSFDWDVVMLENAPGVDMDKTTATAVITCKNCGDSYTRSTTIKDKENQKPSCTNNGEIVLTASVVVNGKTYTDEYTVNVPAGHSIKYVFATGGEKDEYGQIPNFKQDSSYTKDTLTQYHMAVCEKCGTYLSGWEKHEYTEFVQVYDETTEKYTDKFAATCVCGNQWGTSSNYWLQQALNNAATTDWEVSVVRVMDTDVINWSSETLNVPKNVNLIFEDALDDLDDLTKLTITVEKGGHVEGTLGENVIVVDEGTDHVDATVSTPEALSAAVSDASEDMKVNVTLDDDVTLTSQLILSNKDSEVNIDLNGNKLTTPSSNSSNYSIVAGKDTKLTIKNGKIEDNNTSGTTGVVSVQDGTVELENVDIKTTRYGVFVGNTRSSAAGGKFTMNGGSITTTGETCCVATNNVATKEGEITLNNVTLKAATDTVVYLPASKVTANINGCTLEGNQGVEIAGGTLNMTNTTIRYSGALKTSTQVRIGGTSEVGALLVKLHHSYIEEDETVNVTLSGVTMTYTGTEQDVKKHVGIYSDTTANNARSREKNFVGSGYEFSNGDVTMLVGEAN